MTKPVLPPDLADSLDPATILVRGGATRSPYDETCEALFMTSGFVYDTRRGGGAGLRAGGLALCLFALPQPDGGDVRGAAAAARRRRGLPRHGERDGGGVRGIVVPAARRPAGRVEPRLVRLLPLHRRRSAAALGHRDRPRRRARSRRLGGGARRRRGAGLLREPVQPGDGDHRSRRGRAPDPPRRRHPRRRQRVRDAAVAEAPGAWAPMSSSIRRPSTSTAKAAVSAARSSHRRNSSRTISARFTGTPGRR